VTGLSVGFFDGCEMNTWKERECVWVESYFWLSISRYHLPKKFAQDVLNMQTIQNLPH